MKKECVLGRQEPSARAAHQSGSFLVRLWTEPASAAGGQPRVRIFLRNLKTGEETYLGDLDQLGETVLRQFQGPAEP